MPKKESKTAAQPVRSQTDPQGSWTGCPLDAGEKPVQDADDL